MITRSDTKGVAMAEEETRRIAPDSQAPAQPEQAEPQDRQKPEGGFVAEARPDQPASHGRRPLFGT